MIRHIIGRRPSPAVVIAVVALVAAVVGTAVADQTATTSRGLTKKKVNKLIDKRLKQFPITGTELGNIVERSAAVNVPANDRAGTAANCLAGEKVIAGGGQLDGPNSAIYTSQRLGNGWRGDARNNNPGDRLFTVFVYCLQA